MNTFEINLSKVLSHSMVWESSRLEVDNDIPLGYYRNGGSPAPGTQESMAEVMKAYRENIIPMIQQQVAAARQYEPEMQKLREEISPKEQALNKRLYEEFGPEFARIGSQIARQNAQAQAETDLGIVSGIVTTVGGGGGVTILERSDSRVLSWTSHSPLKMRSYSNHSDR